MTKMAFGRLVTALGLVVLGCAADDARDPAGTGGSGGAPGSGGTAGASGGSGGSGQGGSAGVGPTGGASGSTGAGATGGASGGSGAGASAGLGGSAGVAVAGTGGGDAAGAAGVAGSAGAAGATGGAGNGGEGGATGGGSGASAVGTGGNAGTSGSAGNGGSAGAGVTSHVFLLFGQSNMAGYARATSADKVEDPRIQVLGFDGCSATGRVDNQWDTAVPPLHECGPGAVGPGDWFSKTLIQKLPPSDKIYLVPCALSGQAVSVFSKGTDRYTWMVNRVKSAQQMGGVVQGMLFHQGESDCGNSTWPGKVQELVADLRTDLDLDDVPFLAGELPHASACGNHNPLVNQLPGLITNAHVISAQGLNIDPADTQWNMHFGHDDTVELGKRYEAKMAELLGL